VLYFHSKGVKSNLPVKVYWWSLMMQYFLMRHADRCLGLLDTHDAVGCDWKLPLPGETFSPHFSGNWWWATGSYLLKLNGSICDSYLCPEFYVGTGGPKVHSMWQSNNNMYHAEYQPVLWIDEAERLYDTSTQ
jgi:hypothetical protein